MRKISWLLIMCVLVQSSARADFSVGSALEDEKHPIVPEVIHSPGKSGVTGYAYILGNLAEGPPQRVFRYEVSVRSTKNGRLIKRIKSDSRGQFQILLPPGIYSVRGAAKFRGCDPQTFIYYSQQEVGKVKPNQLRKVVLRFG